MAVRQLQLDIDTLYTSTWQNIRPNIVDVIFKSAPFWWFLTEKGRMRSQVGGKWIEQPLEYATSEDTIAWIGRVHDLSDQVTNAKAVDPLTTAQFDWRYVTATIYRFWRDDTQNRGKAALQNIVTVKLNNARKSLTKHLEAKLFTMTNPSSDNCIDGLPNIVRDDPNPTGSNYTYGGIPQGNVGGTQVNLWWNNKSKDMSGLDPTVHLIPEMRTMFNSLTDGDDSPDIILTNQSLFELYEDESLEYKQIVNTTIADLSFQTLNFKGRPVMWSPSADAGHMRFLNSNYLYWVSDPDINFEMTSWKEGRTDLDRVAQIICAGNLTCTNRAKQGVLHSIS